MEWSSNLTLQVWPEQLSSPYVTLWQKMHLTLELLHNELALFNTKDIYHITWCYSLT